MQLEANEALLTLGSDRSLPDNDMLSLLVASFVIPPVLLSLFVVAMLPMLLTVASLAVTVGLHV